MSDGQINVWDDPRLELAKIPIRLGDVHVDGRYITNTKKSMICPGMRFIYGKLKAIFLRSVHEPKRSMRC